MNYAVQTEKEIKYLGIHLDEHLRWGSITYIKYVTKKLQNIMYKIKHLMEYLPTKDLKNFALVESHLTYGIAVWDGASSVHINPLKVLKDPSIDLYNESDSIYIQQLFWYNTCIRYYFSDDKARYPDHKYKTRYRNVSTLFRKS